jgi:LuxR family transcriptional regulator, maltose regulon positive regulatory protein
LHYHVVVQSPLLAGKVRVPEIRSDAVPRSRLLERLCEGLYRDGSFTRRLSLISAPAGFGKTTLAGMWVRRCLQTEPRLRVAWLSLDEGDGAPAAFMSHLRAALGVVAPSVGAASNAATDSRPPSSGEASMTALLNELADVEESILLVLDDYHLAAGEAVDPLAVLLSEHLPPRMHLAVVTRVEPLLSLPRLRARGQLAELRAEDLRFDAAEAADFLRRSMKLRLTEEELAALELRTEGWIAGLQLAALSLRGRSDTAAFITSFAGSHRFVLDYLVEEVLAREPEDIRDFLLRTSILDTFCAPLCDAVAGGSAAVMLDALARANLFLVPLDDWREWYRYHRLFSDALRSRLGTERPAEAAALHARASAWYAQQGFPEEAIRHALAAGDHESAGRLIELRWSVMDGEYRSATWLGWARQLPEAVIAARPVLSAGYGWALLDTGDLEASEGRFREAENPPPDHRVDDEVQYRSLPSSIAVARAYRALALGDLPGTVSQASRAMELAPDGDYQRRTAASALLGLVRYAQGDLPAAEEVIVSSMAIARGGGMLAESLGMTFLLADIRIALGRLCEAQRACEESLRLAANWEKELPHVLADLHRGMGEMLLERGDLDAASEELRIGRDKGEEASTTNWRYRISVADARVAEARGDWDGALELLDEAERFHLRTPLPDVRPVDAMRARIWVRRGDAPKALAWARERGLSVDGRLAFLDEFAHATHAMALAARFGEDRDEATIGSAARLLERLLASAEAGGRRGSVIELLALLALAEEARGGLSRALALLERAVGMAEPEGFARVFLCEGPPMAGLLKKLQSRTASPPSKAFVGRLLSSGTRDAASRSPVTAHGGMSNPLPEPLSERELEVLRLLRTDLNGPEIARELYISLNTFRTHTKNIFDKLSANSRRAAVRRAEGLGLGQG